jgi:thiol-disulfide isomerase/thioredoxin
MKANHYLRKRTGGGKFIFVAAVIFLVRAFSADAGFAQESGKTAPPANQNADASRPAVTQVDAIALQNLLKREGEAAKPLLVNFWATWCIPCREEFPDLVKIDGEFRGKIDFITVSLDDLAEINRDVPKFLSEMKAEMHAYLLKTGDEDAAIVAVAKNWSGGLPFTILFDGKGNASYSRMGKVKPEVLRAEIEKLIK